MIMDVKFSANRVRFVTLFAAFMLFSMASMAQIIEPVKWSFNKKKISDKEYELVFKATIDEHWHVYSQDVPDDGPEPTIFTFEPIQGYELVGKTIEPKGIVEFDKSFEIDLKYFVHEAEFVQRIKLLTDEKVTITGFVDFMCCDDTRCIPPSTEEFSFVFNEGNATQAVVAADTDDDVTGTKTKSLWGFFFVAFLGGLAAILTPCVFPMIPMTVSFFIKEDNKAKGRINAIIYGFSIIAIYTIIGSLLAVFLGPEFANFLSTHWVPNLLFFAIFMFFAASFFGMFEIVMPSSMVNKADSKADRGGVVGAIFMALTLVLVSFSCTGPIVGAILVESAGGQVLKPIIGMLGFSLAFAMPFTLFAFFPSWLKNLPKSGGWLNSVKVVLGFIELALGLKFLSIADQTYHWGILDREVYLGMWIVVFTMLGFYLLGKMKFAHDSEVKHISVPRLLMAIITFTFVVYMIPGMFGAPLKALSGYMPPQQSLDFDINAIVRNNVKYINVSSTGTNNTKSELCESPKYADFLHLPHGLEGYFDYDQAMACAKAQNKPLFVDFTGHGCVNCREMEASVWSDPKVLQLLRDEYVVVALYVDDKTALDESDWYKSDFDGKMKKTLGKKNADHQAAKYNINAQPFYVLLDNNGEKLVNPKAYDLEVEHFVDFLKLGLKEFKTRK